MLYRETLDADMFIKFLKRLHKDAGKKVFLIADNLSCSSCHVSLPKFYPVTFPVGFISADADVAKSRLAACGLVPKRKRKF